MTCDAVTLTLDSIASLILTTNIPCSFKPTVLQSGVSNSKTRAQARRIHSGPARQKRRRQETAVRPRGNRNCNSIETCALRLAAQVGPGPKPIAAYIAASIAAEARAADGASGR